MSTSAARIAQLTNAVERMNQKILYVAGLVWFVLVPFLIARFVLQWSIASTPHLIHWALVTFFFFILFFWAWLISGDHGGIFFTALYAQGVKWPVLFSIALLVFSLPCFAALTVTLSRAGLVSFQPAIPDAETAVASVQDFYLWHFMDSIPGLDIPKTLRWENPYSHTDRLSGWILLTFKLAVILPVIGSFATWNRLRKRATDGRGPQRRNERDEAA
jgi:hypothetical protein